MNFSGKGNNEGRTPGRARAIRAPEIASTKEPVLGGPCGRALPRRLEKGIALVITLVMLAIVTVMAIVFLALSRRERSSVKLIEDLSVASLMADAALERAKAEVVAGMAANGSKLHYDLFNSRNYINPNGFDTTQPLTSPPNPSNVSYVDTAGNWLQGPAYLRMLANLHFDPRAPVFVETNQSGAGELRFYLDFNRNRVPETNGLVFYPRTTNVFSTNAVGDPEWIGILEKPEYPHSETNRFIGRIAYLVLPAGKSLDLNFMHNQGDSTSPDQIDVANARNGYTRNQGVGSWELNLAAFLRELNTNNYAWSRMAGYRFRLAPNQPPQGDAFDDARAILAFRYGGRRSFLKPASFTLGAGNSENPQNPIDIRRYFLGNLIDDYGDGPLPFAGDPIFFRPGTVPPDNDDPDKPWPGSLNTNAFTDLQQLFSLRSGGFTNRLQRPMVISQDPYDRYTFYRMAAQLGADSTPALEGKIHLNFRNAIGKVTNTVHTWSNPLEFFTNAADLMLKASISGVVRITNRVQAIQFNKPPGTYYLIGDTLVRTNFSITNILAYAPPLVNPLVPSAHEYTPAIHRILQFAVNIYDNMTNRGGAYPYYPTVMRPLFSKAGNGMVITGFEEVTNSNSLIPTWLDLAETYRTNSMGGYSNYNFYGQHFIIGAKKGHPNFNELALQTYVEVSRKLEVVKPAPIAPPSATNQMFIVSMFNRWGMEAWNSYTNTYTNQIVVHGDIRSRVVVRDGTNLVNPPVFDRIFTASTNVLTNNWRGAAQIIDTSTNFLVVLDRFFPLISDQAYIGSGTGAGRFAPTNQASFGPLEPAPRFTLYTTNQVRFWILDTRTAPARVIDFVSFDNLVSIVDLTTNLYSPTAPVNQLAGGGGFNDNILWDPTPIAPGSPVTVGITNQLAVSAGIIEVDRSVWDSYRFNTDKAAGIAAWRKFMRLDQNVVPSADTRHQTPFVPTRKIQQLIAWQVNDPLVHYLSEDLRQPRALPYSDKPIHMAPGDNPYPRIIGFHNTEIYRPWGATSAQDPNNYNLGLKDPGIRRSDDWNFPITELPTNKFYFYPNIGALGQVHRGTPWQTVYLKSVYQIGINQAGQEQAVLFLDPNVWRDWSGSIGTYPMNDWKLLDVFTAAPNENAARGLLSVNQENLAAWSAVLSGLAVATNTISNRQTLGFGAHEGADPTTAYQAAIIEPASAPISNIVRSINFARANQLDILPNPNVGLRGRAPWAAVPRINPLVNRPVTVFESVGDVLAAPSLSVQSPFLNNYPRQVQHVWIDRAVEYIPQQILSLLRRDEPRFVVYAFGQSLKPAPNSLSTHPDFYNLCTNYQITGEVITKTTFRVEGELRNPNNPIRAVVESYNVLPPPE